MTTVNAIGRQARPWWQRGPGLPAPKVYLASVIAAGLAVLATSIASMVSAPPDVRWALFAVLTAASSQLMLRMPRIAVSFSIADIFTFATALMFGPGPGAVVVAIDAVVMSSRLVNDTRSATRILFNMSAAALAMAISARVFFALSGTAPFAAAPSAIVAHAGTLMVFAALYFALNTGFVAIAVAGRQPVGQVWRAHFMPLWPGYVGGASAAGLTLFLVSTQHGDLRVLLLVMPIPFILYVTFRTAIGRMQDDVKHLTRVNSMYLATIETLAQAVDARDQVTHDHVRRVQANAMRLARALNIDDEGQLRALEAAALLHDTGKIAIPEHILNKPDKLTAAEFETMKRHSVIGADILSTIEFPFPVVPIVRHHHENWDGSGYPDGLRGEQIPIGARILSVVDCFDALTSDRPYRRAYTADRAIGVIRERSGVMYDPAIVATLIRIKDDIVGEQPASRESVRIVEVIAHAHVTLGDDTGDSAITATTVSLAGQLGEVVGRRHDLDELCRVLNEHLSLRIPGLTFVIYQYRFSTRRAFRARIRRRPRGRRQSSDDRRRLAVDGVGRRSPEDDRQLGGGARPREHGDAAAAGTATVSEYRHVSREAAGRRAHCLLHTGSALRFGRRGAARNARDAAWSDCPRRRSDPLGTIRYRRHIDRARERAVCRVTVATEAVPRSAPRASTDAAPTSQGAMIRPFPPSVENSTFR